MNLLENEIISLNKVQRIMEVVLETVRLKIKFKMNNYYICKDWNDKIYKVLINKYIADRKVGDDFYVYLKKGNKFIFQTYIPISDREAGVRVRS